MGWILFIILQLTVIVAGIRWDQRAGLWNWSKFFFAVGFAALEILIVSAPLYSIDIRDPRFLWAFMGAWVVAGLNFIWMILVVRRWKLADGRTSLEAYRNGLQK
jgi:hypothetical protein